MNSQYVIDNLIAEDVKTVDGINFYINRYVNDGHIIKDIKFTADGDDHSYQERVRAFTLKDFQALFEQADVHLLDVFGDYKLRKFDAKSSERLVMIFK